MKKRILTLGLLSAMGFLGLCFGGQIPPADMSTEKPEITTLFLVRHTEKANDGTYDPPLTPEGTARAEELAYLLGHVTLDAVYATPFKRTLLTVEPVAKAKGLEVAFYKPDDDSFLADVLEAHPGGTVLICGHSNTIPGLANQIVGSKMFGQLEDAIYDNLFIATVPGGLGSGRVLRIRFGERTPVL
jgi:broad specificity phosphatase PhoE